MNLLLHVLCLTGILFSIEFNVHPYLQNASTTTINIMWETNGGDQSLVEYGLDNNLGQVGNGTSFNSSGSNRIHDVTLSGLLPSTRYYYKVTTNDAQSEIYNFITPSLSSAEQPFKLIAMSDMQRDSSFPSKFQEIVHDGIITYIDDNYSSDIAQELGFVLVTGDLVDNGNSYSQWAEHFFGPAHPLFAHVPLYPVLGNHENNTSNYFEYFHTPQNGSEGYMEHWWYFDYSNTRVIGLDSNSGYQIETQLTWLDGVLEEACYDTSIDFVFAQLHHPYLSELWIAGNTNYTGGVISRLENFTTLCAKPSIHFFGHTHGYSRGQSIDHNHLWVNVATAGGNIDSWNEYAQADYEEFTVSQDDWGFVVLSVDAGDDPKFSLKRVSRGNEETYRDNEVRDEVTIRLNNASPQTPIGTYPSGTINPDCVNLTGSTFVDEDGDLHGASQWQLNTSCDFTDPDYDLYRTYQNWYNNVNTQVDDNLQDEFVTGLQEYSNYCWKVRYRDRSLKWSDWSNPVEFTTTQSSLSENLIINPGAEDGTDPWVLVEGNFESFLSGDCEGIESHSGARLFGVGGVCSIESDYGEAYQLIDISNYAELIDNGTGIVYFGGYLSDWGGDDLPEAKLQFLNENSQILSESLTISTLNASWTYFNEMVDIPSNTRNIKYIVMGTRNAGNDNDSYFDDLHLRILVGDDTCNDEYLLGDLNNDTMVNILDIILLVNMILTQDSSAQADLNLDGIVNILDIILIVNMILNR